MQGIVDSPEAASWLFKVLEPHLPDAVKGGSLVELNERLRFHCYTPGQEFAMHKEGTYVRPDGHPRAGDRSRVTMLLYLHDVPAQNGGATALQVDGGPKQRELLRFQPTAGSALVFSQDIL